MANLLQSSQNQATTAPSYYTNYLSNLATAGQQAQSLARYQGAQPLQTQAFCAAGTGAGSQNSTFNQASGALNQATCAARQIAGSANPYLQAGTSVNPLCVMAGLTGAAATSGGLNAANPYLMSAALNNPAQMAQSYMNPYICSAANKMSDIAQRNIQMNLAPQATAAAVGSGQFGSQRGAQVLGQVEANAEQCLSNQIANMYSTGYGQALCAAGKQQSLLGSLGNTAGTLQQQQAALMGQLGSNVSSAQQAYNTAQLQAAQTAANAQAAQATGLTSAGQNLGSLGTAATNARLACINALATLGGQQQTIAQNAQCYPLTTLSKLSSLMQGFTIPTTTSTTLCMSPLSAAAGIASGVTGVLCKAGIMPCIGSGLKGLFGLGSNAGQTICVNGGTMPVSAWNALSPAEQAMIAGGGGQSTATGNSPTALNVNPVDFANPCNNPGYLTTSAKGGLIQSAAVGCRSTQNRGALPSSR